MRILKEKSREYKGKAYFKYKVNISADIIKESGIKEGDEVKVKAKKNKIILEKCFPC